MHLDRRNNNHCATVILAIALLFEPDTAVSHKPALDDLDLLTAVGKDVLDRVDVDARHECGRYAEAYPQVHEVQVAALAEARQDGEGVKL